LGSGPVSWVLDLSLVCLVLSFGCLDLSFGCMDLSFECLDLPLGCLDLSFGGRTCICASGLVFVCVSRLVLGYCILLGCLYTCRI